MIYAPLTDYINCGGDGSGGSSSITQNVVAVPEVLINGTTVVTGTTFVWTKVEQAANTFWAGPTSGAPAVPVFRALVKADGDGLFWALTGNAGTNAATNFIGTTDNVDWIWKTNNVTAARVQSAVSGRPGLVGIGGGAAAPAAQLDVERTINFVGSTSGDARSLFVYATYNKWQTSIPYVANQIGVSWEADPAGYAPAPTTNYGGGLDLSCNIATQGDPTLYPTPSGAYFEYSGYSANMNFTRLGTSVSDGQSGAYVYDGHINKPAYVYDGAALKQQIAGDVKLAELGMHNAVAPYRAGSPYTVSTGIQINLADKVAAAPGAGSFYGYGTITVGGTTLTRTSGNNFAAPMTARSTILVNGLELKVASITDVSHLELSAPWTGPTGTVHWGYEEYCRVSVTNGSPTVAWDAGSTVAGNKFTTGDTWKGYAILLGGTIYYISSVTSNTSLELTTAFSGTTGTTNAVVYSIHVAHQDIGIHFQTHSDARNWNSPWVHSHGFSTPVDSIGRIKSLISGVGGFYGRGIYINPDFQSWDPVPAETMSGGLTGTGSALFVDESATSEMTGALFTLYSPVKATQPFIYARHAVSTYTDDTIQLAMATNGAAASGTFTGNFITCYNGGDTAINKKFQVDYRGELRAARLIAKPLEDEATAPWDYLLSIEDGTEAGTTVSSGGSIGLSRVGATGSTSNVALWRTDVGAWSGNFLLMLSNTTGLNVAGTQTFTGNYLRCMEGGTGGTLRFNLDYRGRVFLGNTVDPATPTGGGIVYCKAGALYYIGTAGTITNLAPA